MKIGIDIRNIGKKRTGDEAVFLNLVKNLALIDKENEYFLFTDMADTSTIQLIGSKLGIEDKHNFKIISLKTNNKFTWNFWTLPRYLRKNPVDVYHTQYILPFFVPKDIGLVTHIHDISFNFYPQHINWLDLLFLRVLIPWSIKRAAKIIVVSEFTKKEVVDYYGTAEEKIAVIYNATGDNFERDFSPAELESVKQRYALPEKYLLYVGTLQPRKNIPRLIEAFARFQKNKSDSKLVLVGQRGAHNYDPLIDKTIRRLGIEGEVVFTGYVESSDLPAIYKLADIFVFPSLYEGFGIPIIEAFRSQTPVLASDIPVFHEIAGMGALYFPPQDLDKIERMLYTISDEPQIRQALIREADQRKGGFSWQKSAQRLLELYHSVS